MSILITGATGNIGREVIRYLYLSDATGMIIAAVRNVSSGQQQLTDYPELTFRRFDFAEPTTFDSAFAGIDCLFLLRPPQISDVKTYFTPLLEAARSAGIERIVFLSVQGAESSSIIPHNKIEKLIREFGFQYIFVRPGYFMQNLTTTLLPEIRSDRRITLPAGKATFNWIDTRNIGEATAQLITHFDNYQNQAFDLTGTEQKNFAQAADILSRATGVEITYHSINPLRFYFRKKREGLPGGFALVMTLLHFLPRLQKTPSLSENYQQITGKEPTRLSEFAEREAKTFE